MIVRIATLGNTGYFLELLDDLSCAIHEPLVVSVIKFGPGKILVRPDLVRYKASRTRDQSAHTIALEILLKRRAVAVDRPGLELRQLFNNKKPLPLTLATTHEKTYTKGNDASARKIARLPENVTKFTGFGG